jgi:hypothetical protein
LPVSGEALDIDTGNVFGLAHGFLYGATEDEAPHLSIRISQREPIRKRPLGRPRNDARRIAVALAHDLFTRIFGMKKGQANEQIAKFLHYAGERACHYP